MKRKGKIYILIYIITVVFLICLYIQFERSKDFELVREELELKNLPEEFENLKIIHLSDLHVSKYGKREEKIKRICREEKPDIIFITGDFVSNSYGIRPCLKTLEGIAAPLGVWAVWGNNDNHLKTGDLQEGISKLEIKILKNENTLLKIKSGQIRLIGVDDPYKRKDDLPGAMKNVASEETKILLAHSPEIINKAVKAGVDMVFAGHTHGGQIRFPLVGSVYNHTWNLFKYSGGKYRVGMTQMYVSRGLGMSVIPVRFLCPAELTVFTLKKRK